MIDGTDGDPIELDGEQEIGFADELPELDGGDSEETVISFAGEEEEGEEPTPLIKKLRDQLRSAQQQLRHQSRAPAAVDDDPEPVIPAKPRIEQFDYDADRLDTAIDARDAALLAHAEWKARNTEREAAKKRAADDATKRIEQQVKALGVGDFEARRDVVRERLTDAQLAILIDGADDPARMIYALGRSEARLDELAAEGSLAKFAVMIGKLEKDIKVQKRKAPQPESRVRGATASTDFGSDKELARLEAEADRTGNRTKVIAYNRARRAAA